MNIIKARIMTNIQAKQPAIYKTRLLSIDAWKASEGGWNWNNWHSIESDVYIQESTLFNARALLKFCRDSDWLTTASKGKLAIDDDGYNVVILLKGTQQPILAFCYGEFWEYNGL